MANKQKRKYMGSVIDQNTKMPSTADALEGTHEHMSQDTASRSTFSSSLCRFADSLHNKTGRLIGRLEQEFRRLVHISERRALVVPANQMANKIKFYQTKINCCQYGETR
jgi:hypothetical protein